VDHATQIRELKAHHATEIGELKDGVRELIDALEDLATAKEQVPITTLAAESALNRFRRRIEGLKQHSRLNRKAFEILARLFCDWLRTSSYRKRFSGQRLARCLIWRFQKDTQRSIGMVHPTMSFGPMMIALSTEPLISTD
jgi:hypothetical protein